MADMTPVANQNWLLNSIRYIPQAVEPKKACWVATRYKATKNQRTLQMQAFFALLERNAKTGLLTSDSRYKRDQWLDLAGISLDRAGQLLRELKNNPKLPQIEKIDLVHAQGCIDYLKKHGYVVSKRH